MRHMSTSGSMTCHVAVRCWRGWSRPF